MTSDPSRIADLEEWIRGKEGENLEFKSARTNFHFDELTKYCVAIANEGGGKSILGVTDERPRQIVGSKAFTQPERTRKGLCERIPLGIDFEQIDQGMNLIYEDLIKQSKPAPDFSRTDQYQVGLTMFGTVEDPAFVRFVEKVSKETTAFFHTHDWLLMVAASRGEKLPKESQGRINHLIDRGIIERGKGRTFMLSRKFYEFVGKAADYTRRKGLDREHNLALLKKHIDESGEAGAFTKKSVSRSESAMT